MSDTAAEAFIETLQYYRFREFCDACRENRYIGLCYGAPGVGKTLSAQHYADASRVEVCNGHAFGRKLGLRSIFSRNVVVYTVKVVNSPGQIRDDISRLRQRLHYRILEEVRMQRDASLAEVREQEDKNSQAFAQSDQPVPDAATFYGTYPTFDQVSAASAKRRETLKDPTALVFIDEADRLTATGLDQVREIFDGGNTGVVLIGMPGIEKRLARYPQLYSRAGFVHQFGPLTPEDFHILFFPGYGMPGWYPRWKPPGVYFPAGALDDKEGVAAIIRVTGGNFRLLHRLLAQAGRILEINKLTTITPDVVEAARESLVIGVD